MPVGATIDTSALTLTFADEFNSLSSSPDGSTGTWKTSYAWGNRTLGSNGEQQYYSDSSVGIDPFTVSNGVLEITAAPGPNPLGLPYVSGAITTETSFSQLYGYFEIRAQMPEGQGLWPAFWLLPDDLSWPPELDVVEVLGHDPTTLYFSTHSTVQPTEGTTLKVQDVSKDFHTYGAMWGPETVTMYIDGKEVASMNTPADMHKEMYMLANLAVGGYWPGVPDASTQFPAHMLIDHVRAYAYPGTGGGTVTVTDPSENVGASQSPSVLAPGQIKAGSGAKVAVEGVSIADTWPGGSFEVTVSNAAGRLHTEAVAGVYGSGQAAASITLTGGLASINAALATLTYEGAGNGEWIWVSAVDPQGQKVSSAIIASETAAPSTGGTPSTPPGLVAPADPVQGTNDVPVVTTPSTFSIDPGATGAITGIRFTDTDPDGTFTVRVSGDTGLLRTSANTTVVEQGEGTSALTMTGSMAAINAELETLTYQDVRGSGTEWLWVSVNDAGGAQGVSPVVVSVTADPVNAPPSTPAPGAAPSIQAPDSMTAQAGMQEALRGVQVTDDDPTGAFAVVVSDATGLLWTSAIDGVTARGNGSTELSLQGELDDINAALATLTRQADPAGGAEWLWVSATDPQGSTSYEPIVITALAAQDVVFA